MKISRRFAALSVAIIACSICGRLSAETEMLTQSWPSNDPAFAEFAAALAENHDLNLLTFPGARLVESTGVTDPAMMNDGEAGVRAAAGRVQVNGAPSIVTYYLGRPRPIHEISVWTFNGDQRANQDFEVYVANNAAAPGEQPTFPDEPTLTTGDKILGANGGGFCTTFIGMDGGALTPETVDWVQFRIYRTYKANAGSPARAKKADSWTSLIELQVLADPADPALFATEEERQEWLAARTRARAMRRLREIDPSIVSSLENLDSLRMAIEDLEASYADQYAGEDYLARFDAFEADLADLLTPEKLADAANIDLLLEKAAAFSDFRREALLANPLMDFESLLVRKSSNAGLVANWVSSCSRGKGNYNAELMTLSPPRPDGDLETLVTPPGDTFIGDICLHWDADKMLVTALGTNNRWQIYEVGIDGENLTQVTPGEELDVDNAEATYLPDGGIIYSSTASMLGVPCVAGSQMVASFYRLEPDRESIRQITFEQDQDWCPTVMHNGRVMYTRWEYTDNAHYFTRILMTMNPDGTNQASHYGSNSYWPNSLFFAKPCPDHASKFIGVISGHHGTARSGELILFDPALGRKEADGVVQRIPGYGEEVEPIIADRLVDGSWPKFLHPAPLSDKYFLVACQPDQKSPWGIYLVDVFDNMLPILSESGTGYFEPTPVLKRETPPVIHPRIDPDSDSAVVYLSDIYEGPGLAGVPRGEVKNLRIFSYGYGYRNIGGHDQFGVESSWDAKRILGTVPVQEDGSASFQVPANTPISLQPLDSEGRALQLMRSWLVAMPGEVLSCVGCHESQDTVPTARHTMASLRPPTAIQPWYGPARPFGYDHEVQPVLDEYCVGCHDGVIDDRPNFADTDPGPAGFSNSYHALHSFVRRPGPESDVHILRPLEYHADTSELIQMLRKGHKNVEMDQEAWERLYCWIDMNAPYYGTWKEIADAKSGGNLFRGEQGPLLDMSDRYFELRDLYATAAYDMEAEADRALPDLIEFIAPERDMRIWDRPRRPYPWPLTSRDAKTLQRRGAEETTQTIELANGQEITLARIPTGAFIMGDTKGTIDELPQCNVAIDNAYWMMTTEVTNELFASYFPSHDSRFIDQWWKDHTTPGYPHNNPEQPVIRITWSEAMQFCERLSEETGLNFTLPTESQWEWACRAGSNTPFWYGNLTDDFSTYANLADESTRLFVVKGVNPKPVNHEDWQAFVPRADGFNDGQMIPTGVGQYEANPWGLYDMHGGVAEWTRSDYTVYPYIADDGRNDGDLDTLKSVRGGSWRDRPEQARSGYRLGYEPWQRVYNVGFRVVLEEAEEAAPESE
jgi:formylglycine-generating enzyme required for sulfatase activity